jgi:hypothetical protein
MGALLAKYIYSDAERNKQIEHFLSQTKRFAGMLRTGDTSRPREQMISQLSYNWGQYSCEMNLGRDNWKMLERASTSGDWSEIEGEADRLLAEFSVL